MLKGKGARLDKVVANLILKRGMSLAVLWVLSLSAQGANILYVANGEKASEDSSYTLVSVLKAEGHTVTEVFDDGPELNGNATLQGDLSPFGAVYWAASDDNKDDPDDLTSAATISALEGYAQAGGFLYITGYDSIESPDDPLLADFIAGASNVSTSDDEANGTVSVANVLTQGVVDLVGVEVKDLGDQDEIDIDDLGTSATGVSCDSEGCSVILRTLGSGYVAYVSTDDENSGDYADSDVSDDYYAYNGFLRNFASNAPDAWPGATSSAPATPVPALPLFGLGILASLLGLFGLRKLRQ